MAIFGPKFWVNPFGKMSVIRLFELLLFIAQKGVLSFQNIVKDIFLAYIALKKSGKNGHFSTKTRVNPFEKMSIFRLFELLVFITQKGVFSFQNIAKDIFVAHIAKKKKKVQKWPFLDQNLGLTPLEKCQFYNFLNFLFLQPRKAFFPSRIS